ncbi:MAG: rhodanese-like domain-containing protein [Bdellovibrio sp.]|nr:MAG: rhodanese-like domain-containing protein [Bdellovibrio sp.]
MSIGFFQFDNLIRQRVPFVLLSWECDLSDWYAGLEAEHLRRVCRDGRQVDQLLPELRRDLISPVVLLCRDGIYSSKLAAEMGGQGFTNVFFVLGGLDQMLKERGTR